MKLIIGSHHKVYFEPKLFISPKNDKFKQIFAIFFFLNEKKQIHDDKMRQQEKKMNG